jgi:hypothetical protein
VPGRNYDNNLAQPTNSYDSTQDSVPSAQPDNQQDNQQDSNNYRPQPVASNPQQEYPATGKPVPQFAGYASPRPIAPGASHGGGTHLAVFVKHSLLQYLRAYGKHGRHGHSALTANKFVYEHVPR